MSFLPNTSKTCIFQIGGLCFQLVFEFKCSNRECLEESRNGLFYLYLIVKRRKKSLLSNQIVFLADFHNWHETLNLSTCFRMEMS